MWGPYTERASDIFLIPRRDIATMLGLIPGKIMISCQEVASLMDRPHPRGAHDLDGVLMMWGPRIKKNGDIGRWKIWDIAPTILTLCNLPIPLYFDGKPITPGLKDVKVKTIRRPMDKKLDKAIRKIKRKIH